MATVKIVCMYCGIDLTFTNYSYYKVRKAVKPPKQPYRFINIGCACDECIEIAKHPSVIDGWRCK